jgi:hypothetical protein
MNLNAVQTKLDELLRIGREHTNLLGHNRRTLDQIHESFGNPVDSASAALAKHGALPQTAKNDGSTPPKPRFLGFLRGLPTADKIQACIGILLLGTLIYSIRGFEVSKSSFEMAKKQFVIDQRPYLWVKPQSPVIEDKKNLSWSIEVINYGKSPALNVKSCILGWWGSEAPIHVNAPPPDLDSPECKATTQFSMVIPPQGDVYTSPSLGSALTPDQLEKIRSLDRGLLIHGRTQYTDSMGNTYESAFCTDRLANGAVESCGDNTSNYIK